MIVHPNQVLLCSYVILSFQVAFISKVLTIMQYYSGHILNLLTMTCYQRSIYPSPGVYNLELRGTDFMSFVTHASRRVLDNANKLLDDALLLYENQRFPRATICAMTCVEECGKLLVIRSLSVAKKASSKQESTRVEKLIRNHTEKTLLLSWDALFINSGSFRRQGLFKGEVDRTSGIHLLAKNHKWMEWRNACFYTDVCMQKMLSTDPSVKITKAAAYYYICMAYEAIAECAEAGYCINYLDSVNLEYSGKAIEFWKHKIEELEIFMSENSDVNVDDYFALLLKSIAGKIGSKKM